MSRENISYYLDWELSVCPKLHSYQFTYPSSFPIKKSIIKTTAFRSFGLLVFVFKRVTRSTTGRESVSLGTELDTVNVKKKKNRQVIFFIAFEELLPKCVVAFTDPRRPGQAHQDEGRCFCAGRVVFRYGT